MGQYYRDMAKHVGLSHIIKLIHYWKHCRLTLPILSFTHCSGLEVRKTVGFWLFTFKNNSIWCGLELPCSLWSYRFWRCKMFLHYFAYTNVSLRNKSLAVGYIRLKLSSDDCNSGKLSFSQQWLWKFFWNVTSCSLVEVYQCLEKPAPSG